MNEGLVVPLGILLASLVLALAGVLAILPLHSPIGRRAKGVPVRLLCPVTGDATRVELDLASVGSALEVVGCERFPSGPIECDRSCLPRQEAVPLGFVA